MKKIAKIICSLILAVMMSFCAFGCAFKDAKTTIIQDDENTFAFTVQQVQGNPTVFDAMKSLAGEGKLSFKIENGMVTQINAVANADGTYWFLYTSDPDYGSSAFGEIEFEGQILLSAVVGAQSLTLKEGHTYLWEYKSW